MALSHLTRSVLINSPDLEIWPASLIRARRNAHARAIALSNWVIRRKSDGRYLAALSDLRALPLCAQWDQAEGVESAFAALDRFRNGATAEQFIEGLETPFLNSLGINPGEYATQTGLPTFAEPGYLSFAGWDMFHRALWMAPPAARAWRQMQAAAFAQELPIQAISAYRSVSYQFGIFQRKLSRGIALENILQVNAAPGFSEHHSGRAIDIGISGEPAAEESFENTRAYHWLCAHANNFGFHLSYPRNNPHGISFEPWHWCWHPPTGE